MALGGAGLMAKGVHDYGKGLAELIVDILLLPVHLVNAFRSK